MDNIESHDEFASYSDEELVVLAQQNNDKAFDYILKKYHGFVCKKSLSYYIIGAGNEDIIQEGMIGLFKAVRDFSSERGVSFKTFADVCVTRQIITAVKNANRQKHAPLNFYVSLNKPAFDNDDSGIGDLIACDRTSNPEDIIISKENADKFGAEMNRILSQFELLVLSLYLQGYSYTDIAKAIGKDSKSVDNALQRIKKKIGKDTF